VNRYACKLLLKNYFNDETAVGITMVATLWVVKCAGAPFDGQMP